ncbi:hypothetical protein GTY65_00030 [Streptomyces sp. SID8379]|uniref:hypothetical protein n=1 Tax=unclassified Streptomyces TaxID=2593676 RepID=UPI001319F63C|nr:MULTISPECIES: hypothetical protein [unclassified Streptomyces]MYW62481.1 hypothetical protein [Streptomyces sp. SID8379]
MERPENGSSAARGPDFDVRDQNHGAQRGRHIDDAHLIVHELTVKKDGFASTEKRGRATIPGTQNSGAFHTSPAPAWRMLDNDPFYLSNPGFEHCTSTSTTCTWQKIG